MLISKWKWESGVQVAVDVEEELAYVLSKKPVKAALIEPNLRYMHYCDTVFITKSKAF